jgi:hypothetical protein
MEFFESFDPLLKAFWYIALPTSLIFVIQTIMTFIGADASDGIEADFNGDFDGADAPFQLFSLRNLINFLLGFSWGGVSLYNSISNHTVLIIITLLIGVGFVLMFLLIIRQIQKLAEDNSFSIKQSLNKTGTVYLKIPANKSGQGIVQLSVRGSVHEINAVTDGEEIPTGGMIRVTQILDSNLILVNKL